MKESDIVYENGKFWVYRDTVKQQYTVFESGITHSTSVCAFTLDTDGLSFAKATCDYKANRL